VKYLLDTNVCMELLRGRVGTPLEQRVEAEDPENLLICSIVKAELIYGIYRSADRVKNALGIQRLFDQFASLYFDDTAAARCGEVRAFLARAGRPIGPNDLLIASIALANVVTLVSSNLREFQRVPGLMVEDWTRP
jgi:tRNA(fMet)-specific endonuclease VapC